MSNKFSGAKGILIKIFVMLLTIMPLVFIGLPWWADFLIILVLYTTNVIGGIVTIILWIWSFIKVVSGPIALPEIIYFVFFAVYLVFFFIPAILSLFSKE